MNWLEGQEEAYRGRTQLYPQEFPQGNASLRLSDVRLHDEGSYLCSVTCDSEMERPIIVQTGEDVILNCSFQSELNHQPLNITWKREEEEGPDLLVHSYCSQLDPLETQDEAYRGRTQLYPERFHEGNASLRLKNVRLEDDGVYSCHVKPELGRFSMRMRVAVEKAAELVQSPSTLCSLWLIDLGVLLVILAFAFLRMYYPFLRKPLNKKSPRSESQQTASDHKKDKEERSHLLRGSSSTSMEPGVANPTHSPPAHSSPGQTAKDRGEPRAAPGVQIVPTLISIMQQKALEYTKLNIAIMGELGCGKSSFINTMRGLCDEDEGAAPLGEEEMMMEPKAYQHPKHPSVTFWRLPVDFQPCLQPVKFVHYDFFVIMGLEGFTCKHAELAREILKAGKVCYFVRSKVDADLASAKRSRPSTYDEENILHDIHNHCIRCLGEGELINPEVFLLSTFELNKYDFPRLRDSMEKALPGDKKRALILALPNTSLQILQKKKEALQNQIWKIALVSSLITVIHIPGISTILDIIILLIVMRYHCLVFGLDDVSFTALTRQFGKPAEELKAIMKPQLAKEIRINVVLQLLSSVGCGIFTGVGLSLWPLQSILPAAEQLTCSGRAGGAARERKELIGRARPWVLSPGAPTESAPVLRSEVSVVRSYRCGALLVLGDDNSRLRARSLRVLPRLCPDR
ncbi:Interferon-inducible GTPase 5 [Chelonia mydas]|uniref:Interferon-inducible GTPase 5 n=1 Tax=Chelonia mydas TaxID=8469 RepID=M7BTM3_CHEMY|nr:Interferon-inducible GTPase 5 [Chelonia mydas]